MADWTIDENGIILAGYPLPAALEYIISDEYIEIPPDDFATWGIDGDILDGYPYLKKIPVSRYMPFVDYVGVLWKTDTDVFDGYPFIFNPGYAIPGMPFSYASFTLTPSSGLYGYARNLIITVNALKYVESTDSIVVKICDSEQEVLYEGSVEIGFDGSVEQITCTVPEAFIETLNVGMYSITVFLKHQTDQDAVNQRTSVFTVTAPPELTVKSIDPAILQKPVNAGNNELSLVYEVTGEQIEQIINTFEVAGFQAVETVKSAELLVIESETRTGSIYDVTMNFTVTDSNFKLLSFKFKFGLYNSSTEVDYRLDGVTVQKGNYPMGGWVEYVAPTPIALSPGTHSIRLYNSPSYWYLYSTTVKPTAPGLTITSATLYAMEMVYSISSSGVGGERTIKITVDDTVQPGDYPVTVESDAILDGYGEYMFNQTTADMLTVLESQILDPSIGGIALNKSGRYAGCETDVEVLISGLANIIAGDTLTVSLKNESAVLYENIDSLSQDITSYSYTIPASEFTGLSIGAYSVTAEVKRDGFSEEKSVAYDVIAVPTVDFVSIMPDTIQLPLSAPITINSAWAVNGNGVNSVQGNITLNGTVYSANINTSSMAFNAVFANVYTLAAGLYALNVNLTLTSSEYGTVSISDARNDSLTVLAPIPEPEIGSVSLSVTGRYIGSETAVTVTASALQNILDGDTITVQFFQSATIFYEYAETLTAGAYAFTRAIPQDKFVGLSAGNYTV